LLRLIILHEKCFFVLTEQPILEIMVVYKNNIENSGCVQNRYLKMQLCSNCVISQIFFKIMLFSQNFFEALLEW